MVLLSSSTTLLMAIINDTSFYHRPLTLKTLLEKPVLAPLNSLVYNTSTSSLAEHGLHPRYQHFLVNFPLLLGPALPLLLARVPQIKTNVRFVSAVSATALLSLIPHQEARFLIPIIPLLLSSLNLPSPTLSPRSFRLFAASWILFNAALGLLYGRYHQAGVAPAQMWLGNNKNSFEFAGCTPVFWWKTYSPPVWLLNTPRDILNTTDLMGTHAGKVEASLRKALGSCGRLPASGRVIGEALLVVPHARSEPSIWRGEAPDPNGKLQHIRDMSWTLLWSERRHVGLDDLDFAEDGVWGTVSKVIRNRGLDMWKIKKDCE